MPHLNTLNIRNLPEACIENTCLSNDVKLRGFVDAFLGDYVLWEPWEGKPQLRTLALGATTYGNTRIGTNHFTGNNLADYVRLRVYNVDYIYHHRTGKRTSSVDLVAKGFADDALGFCKHMDLLDVYWLDAGIREPKTP